MSNAIPGANRDSAGSVTEPLPTALSAPPPLSGFAAGITGAALLVAGVWGLHVLSPGVVSVGSVVLLLAAFTALGKGITLIRRALAPLSAAAVAPMSVVPPLVRALASIAVGAVGIWWVMRGYAATWWAHATSTAAGSMLMSALVQVAVIVVAGTLLFGGAKNLAALLLSRSSIRRRGSVHGSRHHRDRWASWWSSHPGLGVMLLAGGAAVVALSGYVVPRVSGWLLGGDPAVALAAIVALLAVGLVANTWWWGALSGWWSWTHRPHTPGGGATPMSQMRAGAAVVALLWFSATAFGLAVPDSYSGPGAMPRARADCPPDCGGSGGSGSFGPNPSQFQPPQMPDPPGQYQGGANSGYPGPDQNNGISIYNPSSGQGGYPAQGGYPQQGAPGPPANGVQPPDYDAPLPSQAPAPQYSAPAPQQGSAQQPAQAPEQPVQQVPAQQGAQQQPGEQSQSQLQPGQQQSQNPANQHAAEQVQQPQNQKPGTPTKEPDNNPVDPTDLAAAATRRGSQQAGQQATQQGAQTAQQGAQDPAKEHESARVVKQSGDLFKTDIEFDDPNPLHHHAPMVMHPGGTPPNGVDPETGAHVLPGEGEDGAGMRAARPGGKPPAGTQPGWNARVTNNGKGMIYQQPGSTQDSNSVRVMDPGADPRYPDGYVKFTNQYNQPIGLDGKPANRAEAHIPRNPDGSYPIPKGWDVQH
ncbi:hypothetical protein [Mycolicibacterium mucogenicum]|uniref:hypothetical protein n=1 Tax=Mycolicibacterium mucogenicum TaxID=56689 RepID=UPI000AC405DE|nr:hypothetical protein [Mycolicibacterium mucogenicum]